MYDTTGFSYESSLKYENVYELRETWTISNQELIENIPRTILLPVLNF